MVKNNIETLIPQKRHGHKMNIRKFCGLLTLALFCFTAIIGLPGNVAGSEGSAQAAGIPDQNLLEGRWIRSDGGYVLELYNIANDGNLMASYFNPQSIRVFQSFWSVDEGALAVFVELRDVNYPGSKYSLRYDPSTDRLRGFYFQAMEQQVYEIEFLRKK